MVGFTKSLAKEVGRRGVRVNVVLPGYVATDMTAAISSDPARLKAIEVRGEEEEVVVLLRVVVVMMVQVVVEVKVVGVVW